MLDSHRSQEGAGPVAFFNNKGGVGKTSLVYHLAWMLRELGRRVVAADLDPQANLTGMFLDETGLERLWRDGNQGTIDEGVAPLFEGTGISSSLRRSRKSARGSAC